MRRDIQILRGIAVLSVLLYHASIWPINHGFLGVDVFFVISGFLITRIILKGLRDNNFSLSGFYLRRAKRLLPALYCTLIFTTLIGFYVLTNQQWLDLNKQLLGAVTFTSNIVLPFQVGYFESTAETKPLLHIWSLSLEEQYYFALPLLLLLTPKRYRGKILIVTLAISLLLCLAFIAFPFSYWRMGENDSAAWAFYLLPTRAWELLAGSVAAYYMLKHPNFSVSKSLKWIAFLMLFVLMCFSFDSVHPRSDAIIIVIATCVLVLGKDNWIPKKTAFYALETIGNWSYSLYLVHWPLFAYAEVMFLGDTPIAVRLLLCCLSLGLAYLQYSFVEQRFRFEKYSAGKKTLIGISFFTAIMLLFPLQQVIAKQSLKYNPDIDFADIGRPNRGLHDDCEIPLSGNLSALCITGDNPRNVVWGDSFAMQLIPGVLESSAGKSLVQITKSACGPVLGLAHIDSTFSAKWARQCMDHNMKAMEYIVEHDSIKHVILSSAYVQYLKDRKQKFLIGNDTSEFDPKLATEKSLNTINLLLAANKRVTIVSPAPKGRINTAECQKRIALQLPVLGSKNCNIELVYSQQYYAEVIVFLKKVERTLDVEVVWLDDALCDDEQCLSKIGVTQIYMDSVHLSVDGAKLILTDLLVDSLVE